MNVEDKANFDDALERAAEKPAFSNGSEWEIWSYNVCFRCVHEDNCILIDLAMFGFTPAEWIPVELHDYKCSEFISKE